MRTPAGKECRYYYEDFHRGRAIQECRLLSREEWRPRICESCPVPSILQANRCTHMRLEARLVRRWLRRSVEVRAYCKRYEVPVENPYVGCGRCHPEASAVLAPTPLRNEEEK
ncbi:MAG TPA: hypothetical protein ENK08_11655 [Chloroflexi bacterium]|nr:hypothetical protein [Chloroflexota bacterium]